VNLLGFDSYRCSNCEAATVYPLRQPFRVIYWLILVLFGLGTVGSLVIGDLELSSAAAAIFAAVVLFLDMKRKQPLGRIAPNDPPTDL
jgi:hypothetical protein